LLDIEKLEFKLSSLVEDVYDYIIFLFLAKNINIWIKRHLDSTEWYWLIIKQNDWSILKYLDSWKSKNSQKLKRRINSSGYQ
jgi:hypothetical protein